VYSSEYASGFFAPAASHLPAAPFPRNEGLLGQTPTGIIHKYLLQRPILSPGAPFSLGLLDRPQVRLRLPHVRDAATDSGLSRFATAFLNNAR
jgi:hypothetical protein